MKEEFITFQKFSEQVSALALGTLLKENNIDYLLEDNSVSSDPIMSNNELSNDFRVKLKKSDFEKAEDLLQQISQSEIDELDKDYYLFGFSDDELMDLIAKRDEWSQFDFLLAQKLLKERGREISSERIAQIRAERIAALSKPEESQISWIISGYVFAFLGGLLGIFIGWYLSTHKKTLPNGDRIYVYSENDRIHGRRIVVVGIVFITIYLLIRLWKLAN